MSFVGDVFDAVTGQDSRNAASAQVDASRDAMGTVQDYYGKANQKLAPYSRVGQNALFSLADMYGFSNPQDRERQQLVDRLWDRNDQTKSGAQNFQDRIGWSGASDSSYDFGELTDDQINSFAWSSNRKDLEALREMDNAPAEEAGAAAPDYSAFFKSPGYQFRLNEGVNALQNSAAAQGILNSGTAAKGITEYGQNFGSNEYTNQFNRLMGLAGMGQNAATNQANAALQTGNSLAQLQTGIGNARASGYIGQGDAIRGLISTGAQAWGAS